MTRRRTRGLTEDDRALWNRVKETAEPLHPDRKGPIERLPDALARRQTPDTDPPEEFKLRPFRVGERATSDTALRALPPTEPQHFDRKRLAKLKRGKIRPDARIDLHGMTLAEAHPALIRFILQSQAAGHRLVLVITGKGKGGSAAGSPEERGVLRRQVPHWLRTAPCSSAVLQLREAHHRDGGAGAFYVALRRNR
jgi:DNA-nicking Smr family endonuclease